MGFLDVPKKQFANPAINMIRNTRGLAGEIGKKIKRSRTAVWMWTDEVPAEHAVIVARALRIPVHKVCPRIFPPPAKIANVQRFNQKLK